MEGVTWEDLSMEEFFFREENIHEGAQDFLAIFKKMRKNIQLGVMSSIKT